MLFLISPAKSLDYESPVPSELPHTLPVFKKQPLELIEVLREKSPQQISELMSISDKLAVLNVGRYEAFSPRFTAKNSRQAVLAFNGDVYEGLDATGKAHGQGKDAWKTGERYEGSWSQGRKHGPGVFH